MSGLRPVDMADIFVAEQPQQAKRVTEELEGFQEDEKGRLVVRIKPDCCMIILMLPCPFLSLGCVMSESINVIFDNETQTVHICNYPGYLNCCPFRTCVDVAYEDIANIGFYSTGITQFNLTLYDPVLVTKNRNIYQISKRGTIDVIKPYVLYLHKQVYGRSSKEYVAPNYGSLRVPGSRLNPCT